MNRRMKEILREGFEAPPPVHKQFFLSMLPPQRISNFSFMLSQLGYIRKRVLVVSIFFVTVCLAGACFLNLDMLWIISAFMPFIALSALTESFRSAAYGMDELEMSTRFSLRSVVLARIGILGVFHLILLCLLMPLAYLHSIFNVLQVGVYLLVPYLLTDVTGLWAIRNIKGKEGLYACMGIAVFVSVIYSLLRVQLVHVLYINNFEWSIVILVVLVVLCIKETGKMIQWTEELRWNLL